MKLINRTYLHAAKWLFPVLIAGSIFSFYTIKYIIYEETDEFLTYEMERLISYHKINNDLPEFHRIADIIEGLKIDYPVFKDTLMLESGDNEMVPYRELHFYINHNGQDFTIVLRNLLPGNDDLIEGTLLIITGLILLISIVLLLMVKAVSGRIWKPFFTTLNMLTKYQITEPVPVFSESGIDEFNALNTTVKALLKKISLDYNRTKEFNENASHELQTHLAIIRASAENLLNTSFLKDHNPPQLQTILNATIKLSNVQKSLLLLSKIGNLEFNKNISLDLSVIIHQTLSLFQETIAIRNIALNINVQKNQLFMDAGLAEILVSNLIKNAIKHNVQDGNISIHLTQNMLVTKNTGLPYSGDPKALVKRFSIGKTGNLGLGLAIVKQICELYNFELSYTIEQNIHSIKISFPST